MPETTQARGLDHLVIGVADLDTAGTFYERLGFRVGARNRHPWGTENRIVQFPGAFLELITIGDVTLIPPHAPRHFSFGAFVRDALARGEGMSMLALESRDAVGDANGFRAAGIGDFEPFFFERQARRPDGSEVRVAFSLAFAENQAASDCGFFVCQQHEPQNFWNPAFQQHENGASGLSAVFMVTEEPAAQVSLLGSFSGAESFGTPEGGLRLPLPRGRLEVLTPEAAAATLDGDSGRTRPYFAGFAVTVPNLEPIRARLVGGDVAHHRDGARLVVSADAAFGCVIAFEQG
ncbi:VOC family protein [Bosea vestrisii]|uniref:VOC family protein n=1 Tax=Bosea vestrisii TaxID=151416 RepID=UPI0024DFCB15|nr:VOC family protein [Bosea vestrisii]WID97032.1 VOC family protein [Bosea vestrisii]